MDYESLNFERVCACVDLGAVRHNVTEIKNRITPGTRIMAVIKAGAYGHGAVQVARAALSGGAEMLGVATAGEGAELRKAGINSPILIFCGAHPNIIPEMINYNLAISVYSLDGIHNVSQMAGILGKQAEVHIKIDTGMNRVGFNALQKDDMLRLWDYPNLNITGIYSHFADSDNAEQSFARNQFESFLETAEYLKSHGAGVAARHMSNSAAIINYREFDLDIVRAGIAVYGLADASEAGADWCFKPALSLIARINHIKEINPGETVGYSRTYKAGRKVTVATAAVGYADGYSRALSNKGFAIVNGVKVPIIGNICMDQLMLDVTGIPGIAPGSAAVFIGQGGGETITAADAAKLQGTIAYEVVTSISGRVPRIYL